MNENMIIRARAPLRLGLAGGGTDVSPYCDMFGGYVLNATIDRYAYAVLKKLEKPVVRFTASDENVSSEYPLDSSFTIDSALSLHKSVYLKIMERFCSGKRIPLELTTFCDAPPGSGLGSSSTLVVAMVRAFAEMFKIPLDDYRIADLAYEIERVDCGLQGGRQDQYSAAFGGFNFMEFYGNEKAVINTLRIKNWIICELEASLLLYYTGVSRESAKIISDQSSLVRDGSISTIEAFHVLKNEAIIMKECLMKGDFNGLISSMRQGWESKKRTANTISNKSIDDIYQAAINAGASAGKVSGAGGGGFMMFFVAPDRRMELIRALSHFGGSVSNVHFTKHGTQAWSI